MKQITINAPPVEQKYIDRAAREYGLVISGDDTYLSLNQAYIHLKK